MAPSRIRAEDLHVRCKSIRARRNRTHDPRSSVQFVFVFVWVVLVVVGLVLLRVRVQTSLAGSD